MRHATDETAIREGLARLDRLALREDVLSGPSYVDPTGFLNDTPGESWFPMYGGAYVGRDRERGADLQLFRSEHELDEMRALSRMICARHPTAICALNTLSDYVLGFGAEYSAVLEKTKQPSPASEAMAKWFDEFLDSNNWQGQRELEAFRRAHRDGECLLALYADSRGDVAMRFVEPQQVRAPIDSVARDLEASAVSSGELSADVAYDWSFGVVTPANDTETVCGYAVEWPTGWEFLPASRVECLRLNVDSNVKRGVSDFWPVARLVRQAEQLVHNLAEGAKVQAAIAFIREYEPTFSGSQVQGLLSSAREGSVQRPLVTGGGSRAQHVAHYSPGTVVDVVGAKYRGTEFGNNADHYVLIEQAVLRMIATRWSMAEYMISADASNQNLASILEAGSPFVKRAESMQSQHGQSWKSLFWKACRLAFEAGAFAGVVDDFEQLLGAVEFEITFPGVAVRNRLFETQQREILHSSGILSPQTWAAEEGYDYAQEVRNGAQRREAPTTFPFQTKPALESIGGHRLSPGQRDALRRLWRDYAQEVSQCS